MTSRVVIDIWSDVMCPWCVIGYKHLEQALAELDGEIVATLRWQPFELNPDMPPQGEPRDAHIARKYGRSPEQFAEISNRISTLAAQAGFDMGWQGEGHPPPAMMWNTRRAHILLRWALETHGPDAQTRLKLALFRAHFQQRRNVSDPVVLLDIAAEAGFDRGGVEAALADDGLDGKVAWEEDRAFQMNITGVPAMVVNGRMLIPGAQDPATYAAILRQAVERAGDGASA
ncbi:DsbA family oxidoreductase [Tsuneonella sp. CC-YZS046]|uniref:DsbA family oxidoreductase n=1 Tax=Tsuneonella sp. CC-YZS046 TaxID=3042152 RepID=UPI002D79686D|nr:DsbA family oxidoreductase [Tsuneonella sp. CC-YZS046]WRO68115.1 DsbA family oxidoreductase [Tsuneonella sp. CC-YZS046]